MEPLRGSAEQISAKTAAVMNMKTIEMMYEDLGRPFSLDISVEVA